ncbi:RING-H2 finger protein ATL5 [Ricinus communis]|uniref:RING-H2 finger protein ATL5 n=1 Tax=Ricinus communis TaxID=3988 RepID=UPI00201A41EF|nr:RING-H2 finger protein ATL5 [Ricinus communis]
MENKGIPKPRDQVSNNNNISYSRYGNTSMLCSGIILFSVVLIMLCYCSYDRCIFKRGSRRGRHLLSLSDTPTIAATTSAVPSQGLDPSVLLSLPVLVYTSKTHYRSLECAVCLSEFVEGEKGRVLPKCNHTFHIPCIDMWFRSHSNCPLCRAPIQYAETVIPVIEPSGSVSGSQPELRQKLEEEKGRSGGGSSSSPASFSLVECKRVPLDLASIVVEASKLDERRMGLGALGHDSVPSV